MLSRTSSARFFSVSLDRLSMDQDVSARRCLTTVHPRRTRSMSNRAEFAAVALRGCTINVAGPPILRSNQKSCRMTSRLPTRFLSTTRSSFAAASDHFQQRSRSASRAAGLNYSKLRSPPRRKSGGRIVTTGAHRESVEHPCPRCGSFGVAPLRHEWARSVPVDVKRGGNLTLCYLRDLLEEHLVVLRATNREKEASEPLSLVTWRKDDLPTVRCV